MIDIYVDAKLMGKSGSGFSIILKYDNIVWKRSIKYGNYSANRMALNALKFGLLSITKSHNTVQTTIHTRNPYIIDMFEFDSANNCYKRLPMANKELVMEVRELLQGRDVKFVLDAGEMIDECTAMTENAIKNNVLIDIKN